MASITVETLNKNLMKSFPAQLYTTAKYLCESPAGNLVSSACFQLIWANKFSTENCFGNFYFAIRFADCLSPSVDVVSTWLKSNYRCCCWSQKCWIVLLMKRGEPTCCTIKQQDFPDERSSTESRKLEIQFLCFFRAFKCKSFCFCVNASTITQIFGEWKIVKLLDPICVSAT